MKRVQAEFQDSTTDFSMAKWMTREDFAANIAVLVGQNRPTTKEELEVFLQTHEGRDAIEAQEEFEGLLLSNPYRYSPLKLRMALEIIKNNAKNLSKLPGKNPELMKSWARACTAYVRYSRAAEATDRIPLEMTDISEAKNILVQIYTQVDKEMGSKGLSTHFKVKEEAAKRAMKSSAFTESVLNQVIPALTTSYGDDFGFFFQVLEEPSEGWITRKDCETLISVEKVEQSIFKIEWGQVLMTAQFLADPLRPSMTGVDVDQDVRLMIANYIETLKAKMKNRLKTQVPAYAIALAAK